MRATACADYDWKLGRTFLAVVRHGSFAAAARELGQAPPTVRRQIAQLERVVGSPLFSRNADGVRTTPLADLLAPHAWRVEVAAAAFVGTARQERQSGMVGIAADGILASCVLPPIVAELRSARAGLRLELTPTWAAPTGGTRPADVTLSLLRPTDDHAVASRLATLDAGLVATAAAAATIGDPDVTGHPGTLVGDPDDPVLARLVGQAAATMSADRFALRTRDSAAALAFAAGGAGVAWMPLLAMRAHPNLVRVCPGRTTTIDVWMTLHPDLREAPQIRAVLDALRSGLKTPR